MSSPVSRTHTTPMPEGTFLADGEVHPLWLDHTFWRELVEKVRADEPERLKRIEKNRLRRKQLRDGLRIAKAAETVAEHAV